MDRRTNNNRTACNHSGVLPRPFPRSVPAFANAPISCGFRKTGQASRHLPQRMQGMMSCRLHSSLVRIRMPPVAFRTGTSRLAWLWPIIGPPKTISAASSVKPPQCSITSRSFVPNGILQLPGFRMPRPGHGDNAFNQRVSGLEHGRYVGRGRNVLHHRADCTRQARRMALRGPSPP